MIVTKPLTRYNITWMGGENILAVSFWLAVCENTENHWLSGNFALILVTAPPLYVS